MITLINTRQGFADRKTASGFCIDTIKQPSSGFLVMEYKKCTKCNEIKQISSFHINKN